MGSIRKNHFVEKSQSIQLGDKIFELEKRSMTLEGLRI